MTKMRKKDTGEKGNGGQFGSTKRADVDIDVAPAGGHTEPDAASQRIHPGARVESASLHETVVVEDFAWVFPAAIAGRGSHIGEGAVLGGRSKCGDELTMGPAATLAARTQTGDRVTLGEGAWARDRARLGDDVTLEDGAIVGDRARIGNDVTVGRGAVVGDRSTVGAGARIDPGVEVRPDSRIEDGEHVGDDHPCAGTTPTTGDART